MPISVFVKTENGKFREINYFLLQHALQRASFLRNNIFQVTVKQSEIYRNFLLLFFRQNDNNCAQKTRIQHSLR